MLSSEWPRSIGVIAPKFGERAARLFWVIFPVTTCALAYWGMRRNHRPLAEGTVLLKQGRFSEALGIFDSLRGAWPSMPTLPVQRGLRSSDCGASKSCATPTSRWSHDRIRVQATTSSSRARGSHLRAPCWVTSPARARELVNQQPSNPTSLLAAAVLALREKNPREACALLELKAIDQLGGAERGLRICQAFLGAA